MESIKVTATRIVRDYFSAPGLSRSEVVMAATNPVMYERVYVRREPRTDTGAFAYGRALESYLKSGGADSAGMRVIPDDALNSLGQRRGKAWTEYKQLHPDHANHCTEKEWKKKFEAFDQSLRNLRDHSLAAFILEHSRWHHAYQWHCPHSGLVRKAELDLIDTEHQVVTDIKTATDESYDAWPREIERYHYDVQAATYLEAAAAATDSDVADWEFAWIVIGKSDPYHVEVYQASDETIELGQMLNRAFLDEYARRVESNDWKSDSWGSSRLIYPRRYDWRLKRWLTNSQQQILGR